MALAVIAIAGMAVAWRFLGGSGDDAQVADGGPLVEVAVPELSGDAERGRMVFAQNCASCHGENAAGRNGYGPPLVHKIYEPSHHGDQAFYLAARQGVRAHHWPFGNMPPVEGVEDREIALVVSYIRTLQRENGIQ
jgi:mono/diheme cytochrome c family protein